jgi:hypothetical protein
MTRIAYRDRQQRVWFVSEVARLKVVSAVIDGPNDLPSYGVRRA